MCSRDGMYPDFFDGTLVRLNTINVTMPSFVFRSIATNV